MENFCANAFFLKTLDPLRKIHCCWMEDSADINQVRRQMLADQQPDACRKCWQAEAAGIPSKRKTDTKNIMLLTGMAQDDLIKHAVNPGYPALSWQVRLGNDCNLACRTCYAGDSTRWYAEWNQRHPNTQYRRPIRLDDRTSELDFRHVRTVEFLGGEPFVGDRYSMYLERLLSAGNTDALISFTTNGTLRPDIQLLRRFKKVNINISIDGLGKRFDYLRWPARWNDVDENISWWQGQRLGPVSCVTTISNMTIGYMDEFMPFALKRFGVGMYHFNVVDYPRYFQPHVLPQEIKQDIAKRYQQHRMWPMLRPFLNMLDPVASDFTLRRFILEICKQDLHRGQLLRDHLPELMFFDDSMVFRKCRSKVQSPLGVPASYELGKIDPCHSVKAG